MTNLSPSARVLALTGYGEDYGLHEALIGLAVGDASTSSSATDVTPINTALGTPSDVPGSSTVIGLLKDLANSGTTVLNASVVVGLTADNTTLAANSARREVLIQNKSNSATLYVRVGGAATAANSLSLLPLTTVTFDDVRSSLLISLLSSEANTTVYYETVS